MLYIALINAHNDKQYNATEGEVEKEKYGHIVYKTQEQNYGNLVLKSFKS